MAKFSKEPYTIRMEEIYIAKTRVISKKEVRSFNNQVEYFVAKGIEQYEKENGEIILPE